MYFSNELWLPDSVGSAAAFTSSPLIDCLLSTETRMPRTIRRQIILTLIPLCIALLISLFALLRMLKKKQQWNLLARRVVLIFIVVSYNSYLALVKLAVDILNCVSVHDGTSLGEADITHRYLVLDTSIECYRGSHLLLAIIVSVPLLLFVFGFPVALAVALLGSSKKGNLATTWTRETMGFLFFVFEDKVVYWDCLILLRKALLSIIAVFAYRLGGNLQGLLALTVLVSSLFLQMQTNPFKAELRNLNAYENVALLASSFTFLCGLVLNDSRFSNPIFRGSLLVLLFLCNTLLLAFFVYALLRQKLQQIRMELNAAGVHCDGEKLHQITLAYVRYQLERLRQIIKPVFSPQDVESSIGTGNVDSQRTVELGNV